MRQTTVGPFVAHELVRETPEDVAVDGGIAGLAAHIGAQVASKESLLSSRSARVLNTDFP